MHTTQKKLLGLLVAISHKVPLAWRSAGFRSTQLSSYHKTLLDALTLMLRCRPAFCQAKLMRCSFRLFLWRMFLFCAVGAAL